MTKTISEPTASADQEAANKLHRLQAESMTLLFRTGVKNGSDTTVEKIFGVKASSSA